MASNFDLAHELSEHNPTPFESVPGAYIYHDQTPAHRFTTVVAPIDNGKHCLALASRDFFDQKLAKSVLAFLFNRLNSLSPKNPLRIVEGFTCEGFSFDSVAVLSPSAGNQFEHENESLNKKTHVAFPMFRCELSGNEPPDLVDLIRHDFLPSLDWRRQPCPKILMAFWNPKTKIRSTRRKPSLTTLQNALTEIENSVGVEKAWIDLENYRGRLLRIKWTQHCFTAIRSEENAMKLDKDALVKLVIDFVSSRSK